MVAPVQNSNERKHPYNTNSLNNWTKQPPVKLRERERPATKPQPHEICNGACNSCLSALIPSTQCVASTWVAATHQSAAVYPNMGDRGRTPSSALQPRTYPNMGGHGRTPSSVLQPRSRPYPNMGGHGGHTHNHRPPTLHSSCRGLVGAAIALRLRVGTGVKRRDVGRRCRDGRVHGVGSVLACFLLLFTCFYVFFVMGHRPPSVPKLSWTWFHPWFHVALDRSSKRASCLVPVLHVSTANRNLPT
eukprot:scaffold61228_cov46-Attheya_sp.AAC.5